MANYIALLRKDKASDYGVEFPDLPGCISAGSTLEEARQMAKEALAAHIAFLREDGDPVPDPSSLDEIVKRPEIKGAVPFMVELKEPADKAVRINITVPERVLRLIDEATVPIGGNRSAFMVSAAEEKAKGLARRHELPEVAWTPRGNRPREAMRFMMSTAGMEAAARRHGGPRLRKAAAKRLKK